MPRSDRLEIIKQELERIRKLHKGVLTPRAVVQAARNKKNPLHREFIWVDARAADIQRLDRARTLIQYHVVEVIERSEKILCPLYIKNPDAGPTTQGYISLTSEELDRRQAMQIVLAEVDRCSSSIERARAVAGALERVCPGVRVKLEDMLLNLVDLRHRLTRRARASLGPDRAWQARPDAIQA